MSRAPSKLAAPRRKAFGLVAATVFALLGVGCGQGDPYPAPPGAGIGGGTTGPHPGASGYGTNVATGPCALEEEVRECHVLIGQHAGITNCFNGIQRCVSGVWTSCQEGTYTVKSSAKPAGDLAGLGETSDTDDPDAPQVVQQGNEIHEAPISAADLNPERPLAKPLTTTQPCNDPCDPTCQSIIENTPYTSTGVALDAWASAASAALPSRKASFVSTTQPALWVEPCAIDSDCQWGMQCTKPVTRSLGANCSHDKCAQGTALSAACADPTTGDACVAKVCAANPDCCAYAGTCAHSPCIQGTALTCPGDPAVATVCANAATSYCCASNWDMACVTAYGAAKGVACPTNPNIAWTSPSSDPGLAASRMTCTQLVHDQCGVTCTNDTPTCPHDICAIGAALPSSCDSPYGDCVGKVCAINSACCTPGGTWSQACIDTIPQACGKACSATSGVCQPYLPNEVDPQCFGPDLVVTTPCFDGNGPVGSMGGSCAVAAQCAVNVPSGVACSGAVCTKSCSTDADCSTPLGGVVCDSGTCKNGCRGSGIASTMCPGGYTCSSTTAAYGTCHSFKVPGNSTVREYAVLCNVGTQATPAGVPVAINVYGGNASPPSAWPSLPPANGAPTRTCSTAVIGSPPLLPGKCIDLPCQSDPNDVLYVNPPNPVAPYASTVQVNECHSSYGNNWSLNLDSSTTSRVACDAPLCSLQNGTVRSLKQHVVIEAENSSAMQANTWNGIRSGVIGFLGTNLGNPWLAADVSAATGYFPDSGTSCEATGVGACAAPPACIRWDMAPIGFWNTVINLFLAFLGQPSMSAPPPYYTALKGALEHARLDQATQTSGSQWNSSVLFVVGSDIAANTYCGSTVTTLSGLAAEYYAKYGIRTFVIAVGGAQLSQAQAIAAAGGGDGYYVANDANTGSNLTNALLKATVAGDQSCQFKLPPVSLVDMSNTTLTLSSPSGPTNPNTKYKYGAPTPVTQVTPPANWAMSYATYLEACLASCPNLPTSPSSPMVGWCYDDPSTPTKIVLCQDTCRASVYDPWASTTAVGLAHSQVTYTLACPSYFGNITYPVPSSYQGFCPDEGMKPLWSYLAYDTVDPTDTSVVFQFQTAQAVNGVCPAPGAFPAPNAYTVSASQLTQQVCAIGQGGGCPIDLVNAMNGGKLNGPMLADCMKLTVTLNPNPQHTFTPQVNGFELRYSCPYVE
jgi:hypothetical protein